MKSLIFGSGVSSCKSLDGLLGVCREALANGIVWFDSAPSYGTEEKLSQAVAMSARDLGMGRESYLMQTKIDPIQMYEGNVEEYFKQKLQGMKLDYIDALLIHWPVFNYFMKTWEAMARLKENGLARRIGISNVRLPHLKKLKELGIVPDILQIERHPLNTFAREVEFCKQHKILLQDYSPLCKMHPRLRENPKLEEMARRYHCDLGQIILRWHIDTGAIPVFTSTKPERVALYSRIEDFSLTREEIEAISSLNCNHKLYLESLVCPGF